MARTALRVSNVDSSHGDFKLEDADFNLKSGDIMGLVGKSGSGKSTLIKTILGVYDNEEGNIWAEVNGEERNIREVSGYSPQENSLYPFMSIQENLNAFGSLRGVSKEEISERSEMLLKELQIYKDRDKRVSNLSGGMKKRADLASCLLHDPEIVVLDEPFAGIDPPQRQIIWDNLSSIADEGKIIVITSHLLKDLSDRCNKYGLVHEGQFYRSSKIKKIMQETDYESIETFLNDVFRF
jgi:ABC-2 type transport system ATP-binding protein